MHKLLLFFLFIITIVQGSVIDDKIKNNELILNKSNNVKNQTEQKIQSLAQEIEDQNEELKKLEKEINLVTKDIDEHRGLLENSKKNLTNLGIESEILQGQKKNYEEELITTIIEDYSSAVAIRLADKNTIQELMESEVYEILAQEAKDNMLKIDNQYMKISQNKLENEREIKKLNVYIEKREKKKKILSYLLNKHSESLASIENKHKLYQEELKNIIKKQNSLTSLLSTLNILKEKELEEEEKEKRNRLIALKNKREKDKLVQASKQKTKSENEIEKTQETVQQDYATDIDLDVRILGSSTKGVKIGRFKGEKTIAPLKSYSIAKKFGKYYDPVYKIQLFNESILLKTKESDSKVFAILDGKVVYSKQDSGMLENVVIIQHKNGLHTIYSHLDQISPTLKVGKWIKKGYVVGRVDDTLTFQAIINNSYINPEELFY